ncbi:four helix bundle protein [Candidatus Dojkabacteria bacterium]|uniref:Four helix bundle protein n=1 Tax=Candidatus Dojkabacteria bacterium TaxID=2099670 RepID=A0A955L1P0_9BACT|nr:four helix bundle protein [Candidatus Dojkabacteria bacterium]
MKDFRNLKIWVNSHKYTLKVYEMTSTFPSHEKYGVISQICRAASSVPTNIAEGCGRNSDADFSRFIVMAIGSISETESLLILCKDLKYISEDKYTLMQNELNSIKMMLISFLKSLKPKA